MKSCWIISFFFYSKTFPINKRLMKFHWIFYDCFSVAFFMFNALIRGHWFDYVFHFALNMKKRRFFFSSFEIADYSNVYRSNILPIDRSHMYGDLLIIDFESIFDRTNSQLKSIDENLIGNPVSSSMPKLLHWPNSKRMCIDLKKSNESPCRAQRTRKT